MLDTAYWLLMAGTSLGSCCLGAGVMLGILLILSVVSSRRAPQIPPGWGRGSEVAREQ